MLPMPADTHRVAVRDPLLRRILAVTDTPEPQLNPTPFDVVFTEGSARLLRFRAEPGPARGAVFLGYALINRFYILDLMPGRSAVDFLRRRGLDVYLLDWGVPGPGDNLRTMDDYVSGTMVRAIRAARACAGVERIPVAGYCQGGTMATIATALHPELASCLVTIATPIDFAVSSEMVRWTTPEAFPVDSVVDALGNVPGQMIQSGFLALQPTVNQRKYGKLEKVLKDRDAVTDFAALEAWSTDAIPFPGTYYRQYIRDLYQGNKLCRGELVLEGRRVDLARITCPVLVVSASQDPIVSRASGEALLGRVSSARKETLVARVGHIGIAVSTKSFEQVWGGVADFVLGCGEQGE
jgi:polyhydroxyalkanoate synthase